MFKLLSDSRLMANRKGQVEKLFEESNCERGTENWEIRELGRKEMKPREGLSISYPFSHLGIHLSSLGLRLSCHQLTGGFVYNVFLQEPSFLPKPSVYQGTFSFFISLESLINAFCFFK